MAYKAVLVKLESDSRESRCGCINPKCRHTPTQKAVYEGYVATCCNRETCMMMAIKHVVDVMEPVEPFYYNPWGEPYFMA